MLGGYGKSLIAFRGPLIERLVKDGHRVVTCTPDLAPELEGELRKMGASPLRIKMQRTGINPLTDLNYLLALRRLIHEVNPDRVLAYTMKPVIYASLAMRLCRRQIRTACVVLV